jgi:hypothetical protein
MRPRIALLLLVGVAAAASIAVALTSAADPYPLRGTGGAQWNPVRLGAPTRAVVVFMEPRPGDRIEFLGAEPIGLPPEVQPKLYLSRPVLEPDGTTMIGLPETFEPIAGAVIETPAGASPGFDHGVGIVAEMTPMAAGTYQLTAIRLRFRTNGGVEQVREGISAFWTVCADDPAPSCEPPETTP